MNLAIATWVLAGLLLCAALAFWFKSATHNASWAKVRTAGVDAFERKDFADALRQFNEARALATQFGPTDPRFARSVSDLAKLHNTPDARDKLPQFRKKEALALSKQASATWTAIRKIREVGNRNPETARSLDQLARLYEGTYGDWKSCERLYARSLKIREKALGIEHPEVADSCDRLARFRTVRDKLPPDLSLLERSLAIREKAFGPEHPQVARSLERLARHYSGSRKNESRQLLSRALAIWEKALGPDHPDVAWSLEKLAGKYGYFRNKNGEKGMRLLRRQLAIMEKAQGQRQLGLANFLAKKAPLLRRLGRDDMAAELETRTEVVSARLAAHQNETG